MSWFSKKGRQEESAAPTRKELRAAFMSYFDVTGDPASERNFIEQHPLLLHPKSTSVLSLLSAQLHAEWQTRPERLRAMGYDQTYIRGMSNKLSTLQSMLDDIRNHGSTIQAIRDTFVNIYGGFALDAPDQLVQAYQEMDSVALQFSGSEDSAAIVSRIKDCLELARQLPGTAPEIVAELRYLYWTLQDKQVSDPETFPWQEAIEDLQAALVTYTLERFPLRFAVVQIALGNTCYRWAMSGEMAYLEKAVDAYQQALKGCHYYDHVQEYVEAKWGLAQAYIVHFEGDPGENTELAIMHLRAALAWHFNEDEYALHTTMLHVLGQLYLKRAGGKPQANNSLALHYLSEAVQRYAPLDDPSGYASAVSLLALAYLRRSQGKKQANIQRAMICVNEVLGVYKPETHPIQYRATLGLYGELSRVSSTGNIEEAIAATLEALRMSPPADPLTRTLQEQLALAYIVRDAGDPRENLEQALVHLEAVLESGDLEPRSEEEASTHESLGVAYRSRIDGERRDNLERAIFHYNAALAVYTPQTYPESYARTMVNLGIACMDRMTRLRDQNVQEAIRCFIDALQVYTSHSHPHEYASVLGFLGLAHSELQTGSAWESRRQAIRCYQKALKVFTLHKYPREHANIQCALGMVYCDAKDRRLHERGISNLCDALRVYEQLQLERNAAGVRHNLGIAYGKRLEGEKERNLKTSLDYFTEALRFYPPDRYPHDYLQEMTRLATTQAALGRWEEAQQSYRLAYEIEDALVEQSAGLVGLEAVLKEVPNIALYEGYCLARQDRIEEAISSIEHGRLRDLGAMLALETADTSHIRDKRLRGAYEEAHEQFMRMRQTMNSQVSFANFIDASPTLLPERLRDVVPDLRKALLEVTGQYREAKANLDHVVAQIRVAGDPADFLQTDLDTRRVLEAVQRRGPGCALVYLMVTLWGGIALAALASHQSTPKCEHYVALNLPALTEDTIHELLSRQIDDNLGFTEGWGHAQEWAPLLADQRTGLSFAFWATTLRALTSKIQPPSLLVQATQDILAMPEMRDIVRRSWQQMDDTQRAKLEAAVNRRYLHHALARVLGTLSQAAMRPLADWLHTLGVTSVLLVPCGRLGTFPLTAVPVTSEQTFGEMFGASILPSSRLLLRKLSVRERGGVYTLGNAQYADHPLPWGEAEAVTLRNVARKLRLPAKARVQDGATREWLIDALKKASVLDLAIHARFEPLAPLESSLFLAHNETLALREVLNHTADLQGLRLLILSACQTAVADQRGTSDEVRSLAVGMLQAGAQATLATLWSIDDLASYLLIVYFALTWLPCMETLSPSEALAKAQCWLRNLKNRDLQSWRTQVPIPTEEELRASGLVDGDSSFPSEHRGLRYSQGFAEMLIHSKSRDGDPNACPFADPIYWAGFQIIGW
ncbi:MAG TPA: CHAT domain-containing protein [Ktedonobacteraceae bacterium]|nr:CHAT domain-containing protein [Ktedonobacteraceae bacterium]